MKNFKQSMLRMKILFAMTTLMLALPICASANGIVNLITSEAGMYRISYADLRDAGADLAGLSHKRLAITRGDQLIAVRTQGQDKQFGKKGKFGPGGYIEFYAEAPDSLYTDQRAYTLAFLKKRLSIKSESAAVKKKQATSTDYLQTRVIEEDRYYDFLAPSKTDPWHYGQFVARASGDTAGTQVNFELDQLVGNQIDLAVQVYGIVDIKSEGNDHHFVAHLNGAEIGDQQFDGNVASTLSLNDVAAVAGTNNFQLYSRSIASTPFDAIGLNKLVLTYRRNAIASEDYLEGRFSGEQALVAGLNSKATNVYRRDLDGSVSWLKKTKLKDTSVQFKTTDAEASYIVVGENGYKQPSVANINDGGNLDSGIAEYLIITHKDFLGSELDDLVRLREADYTVKVVDVEQIYAQYGDHLASADSIHDYIKFAVENLATRFVLLVGSDTYDYKQIQSQSISFVPTKYEQTPGGFLTIGQTPSDASYGELNGDGVPDIPVGRLSVRTTAELAMVVEKIRNYQAREGYAGAVLIAADLEDAGNGISFTDDANAMISVMPEEWAATIRSDFRAMPDLDGGQLAHDKLFSAVNAGVSVLSYIGHSSQQLWSRATPALLRGSEIANFTNIGKPTLVTQWGCWNTYFVDPAGNSMSDHFLVGGLNGAVTVLGASTLTTAAGERGLSIELNKRMYQKGVTIGEAVIDAKRALAASTTDVSDILLGWQIIGDPALMVNP